MRQSVITVVMLIVLAAAGCNEAQSHKVDKIAETTTTVIDGNPQIIETVVQLWPNATYYIAGLLALATGWQKIRRKAETSQLTKALIDSNTPGPIAEPTRDLLKKVGVNEPIVGAS